VSPPRQPIVELEAAHKRFGAVEALKGIDLAVCAGEVVALLGPNGAGKTTAISLMLGLRKPTSGRARLFGMDPGERRARSRCGVMLQESGVWGALTVREMVQTFRTYYPTPLPAEQAIARAGLLEQAQVRVGRLSGGQRQRLYFALAICGDPEVLFLDEPTVGMDVEGRLAFLASIRALAADGRTVVLTTHYLEEADELAERVVVIDHGVVVADAPPRELKSRIAVRRVSFRAGTPVGEATFAGLPVVNLEIAGDRVRLLTSEPEIVLRRLFEGGAIIGELEVAGASLEEAFLSLTGRGAGRRASGDSSA
jgi:ABC-2 type transport system ATP-binding protein